MNALQHLLYRDIRVLTAPDVAARQYTFSFSNTPDLFNANNIEVWAIVMAAFKTNDPDQVAPNIMFTLQGIVANPLIANGNPQNTMVFLGPTHYMQVPVTIKPVALTQIGLLTTYLDPAWILGDSITWQCLLTVSASIKSGDVQQPSSPGSGVTLPRKSPGKFVPGSH